MACEYICDACGKREKAVFYGEGDRHFHKPALWFSRADADGEQDACCRACIDVIAEKTKKSAVVDRW